MDILTKILSSLYLFNCLTSDPAPLTSTDQSEPAKIDISGVTKYKRIVMVSKQNHLNLPINPIDPNHQTMAASGIFNEEDICMLDLDVISELKAQYGIDLNKETNSEVLEFPNGARLWPGYALLLPAKFGDVINQPWVVTLDTEHPERAYQWFQYEFGTMVILQTDYIVPIGQGYEKEGAHITPGSIFFKGYVVHAKANTDMGIEENREIYQYSSSQLATQTSNMWDYLEQLITYPITDSKGNEGFGIASTAGINIPASRDGGKHVEGRIVLTWTAQDME